MHKHKELPHVSKNTIKISKHENMKTQTNKQTNTFKMNYTHIQKGITYTHIK